ncbi:MAG: cobalt-precorrin-6A reductase [Rhizobiales bacterium]|nr:cobalt-precorrin-6A reductase [Hyphomicrobiales bacterium]
MRTDRILVLGGTGEAREVAQALVDDGFHIVTSLAGVTASPHLPVGEVRRGGFGGEAGLKNYIKRENISAIVDATHPYAAQISRHAQGAARTAGVPYLRLERPPWRAGPSDSWTEVATVADAVAALPSGARPFVTIGRKEIAAFFARADLDGVARMIEAPGVAVPPGWTLIQARPPFDVKREASLLESHRITHVVAKNSGGELTYAKLVAARERKIPVVLVARPGKPMAPTVSTVKALIPALRGMLSP